MLTARKEKFVDEYIATGNASVAAQRAGFSPKNPSNARNYACILLKNDVDVKKLLAEKQSRLKQAIAEERAELYPKTKEEYASETFQRAKTVNHAPTASKYWELGGKALGYLSDDKQSEAPIYQVIHNELNINFITRRTQRVKALKVTTLTTGSDTIASPDSALINSQSIIDNKSNSSRTESQLNSTVDAVGGEGPTQGVKLSLIPPDKSLTILNSPSNESTNSDTNNANSS